MKYLRNPTTGEVHTTSPLAAKRLARYGWTYVKRDDWIEYQRAQIQLAMRRSMPSLRLGRVQ